MFKHILVATDGSPLADKAIAIALRMAASVGSDARVSAVMVLPDYSTVDFAEATFARGPSIQALLGQLRETIEAGGRRRLEAQLQQHGADRRIDTHVVVGDFPYEAILETASRVGCDLIVMAARGRGALKSALLGSQTAHVLSQARVPVLVVK